MVDVAAQQNTVRADAFARQIQAVVVGVACFDDPEFPALPNCVVEAQALAEALCSPHGCCLPFENLHLVVGNNDGRVTKAAVEDALGEAAQALTPDGVLFVFFASHGWEDEANNFAIATTDSTSADLQTGLTAESIVASLHDVKAGGFSMITDCCGGAGIAESSEGLVQAGLEGFGFRLVISSASRGEAAWDFEEGGSAFARAFIEALYGGMVGIGAQGEIFLSALFDHLHHEIQADFAERGLDQLQTPRLNSSIARDPLLFANSEASLRSIEFARTRLTPEMLRRRVRRALLRGAGALGVILLAAYAFVNQSRYFTVDSEGSIAEYYGRSWAQPLIGSRLIWQTNLPESLVASASPLGRDGVVGFFKGEPHRDLLAAQLTEAGRHYLQLLSGDSSTALPMDAHTIPAVVRLARAEINGDVAELLELTNDADQGIAGLATSAFARSDPAGYLEALLGGEAYHLLDREPMRRFVNDARAFSCSDHIQEQLRLLDSYGMPERDTTRLRILSGCPLPIEFAVAHGRPWTFAALGGSLPGTNGVAELHDRFDAFQILRFVTEMPNGSCIAQEVTPPPWNAADAPTVDLLRSARVIDWMAHVARLCGSTLSARIDAERSATMLTVRFGSNERTMQIGHGSSLLGSELALLTAMPEETLIQDLLARLRALEALDNPTALNAPPQVLHALAERGDHPEVADMAEEMDPWGVLPEARLILLWRANPKRALAVTRASFTTRDRALLALSVAAAQAPAGPAQTELLAAARNSADATILGMAEVFFGTPQDSLRHLIDPQADHRQNAWQWLCAREDLDIVLTLVKEAENALPHGFHHRVIVLGAERSRAEAITTLDAAAIGPRIGQHLPSSSGCRVFVFREQTAIGRVPSLWEPSGVQ